MGVSRPQKQDLSHAPGCLCSDPYRWHFLVDTSGLWFTSRVQKSLPLGSCSSICIWKSSPTRYALSRMHWGAWWPESLSRVTPPKLNKRWRSAGEWLWKSSILCSCCTSNGSCTRLGAVRSSSEMLNILRTWKLVTKTALSGASK